MYKPARAIPLAVALCVLLISACNLSPLPPPSTPLSATPIPSSTPQATSHLPNPTPRPDSPTATARTRSSAPAIAWQARFEGNVVSGAIVSGDLVFVAAEGGNLHALDIQTGGEVWQANLDGEIAPTLAISGSVLYAGLSSGRPAGAVALNTVTGGVLWRYPKSPSSGATRGTSPVIAERLIVFGMGATLYALDPHTAEVVWTYDAGAPIEVNPVAANGAVYAGDAQGNFYAIDTTTGNLLWTIALGGRDPDLPDTYTTLTTAAVAKDTVYVGHTLDGPIYALDAATGKQRWRFGTSSLMTPVPVFQPGERDASIVTSPPLLSLAGDTLFVGISFGPFGGPAPDRAGYAYALDASTGQERWKVQAETQITGRPTLDGGLLLFASNRGTVHAVEASTGREIWSFEADGPTNTPLLLAQDTIYFGTLGGIFYALR